VISDALDAGKPPVVKEQCTKSLNPFGKPAQGWGWQAGYTGVVTRKVLDDKVVYVDRKRILSVVFFLGGLLLACLAWTQKKDIDLVIRIGMQAALLFVVALGLQHTSRTFVIDRRSRILFIRERNFIFFTWEREYLIGELDVRTRSMRNGSGWLYWIWIEPAGEPGVLFEGNLRDQRLLRDLVVQLREDLGCPGTVPLPPET
jgi:hypothetical protein